MQLSRNSGMWICILSLKQTCHPHLSPPVRPLTRKLFKRWTLHFMYFRSKERSWKKKHASTYRQALNCEQMVRTTWSPDSAIAALERTSHPSPGLMFPTATSGLLPSQNNLVFRMSVWNSWTHPICSDTKTSVVFGPGSVLLCILDKGKWQGLLQR